MTTLDDLIAKAYASQGKSEDASAVYEAVFKTVFFVPSEPQTAADKIEAIDAGEPFAPLCVTHDNRIFIIAFDTQEKLDNWAGVKRNTIDCFKISGTNLIKAMGSNAHLCVNVDTNFYKEFPPDELDKLRKILATHENER